ncbi:MAG: hypothetical protein V4858_15505 [Pseudomonadota bacterium]
MSLPGLRVVCMGLCLLWAAAVQADTLRIGSWDRKTDQLVIATEAILVQAYGELRQPVEFVELPVRRAMAMMLSGDLDGNFYRIASLAEEHPSLFRVESPIGMTEIRAYVTNPGIKPAAWSQLAGLRVAYQRGALVVERNLPPSSQRLEGSSIAEQFRMLGRGMADVVLIVEPANNKPHALAKAKAAIRTDTALQLIPLHHYLLGSHRDFGLRLGTVLARMMASGELQMVRAKALNGVD